MADYKVLLTTSGLGSRLGNLTKFTNKSLVRIGDKPVISHIIDSYPEDVEFVITLGHYGSHVKQYISLAHIDKKVQFVEVDNYFGEGSSLLYSISLCEEYLQTPFIFHACDTILPDNYIKDVDFSTNWSIGGNGENSQAYRTINALNGKIASINEKGEQNFDYVYVGVSGVKDYLKFWDICKNILDTVKTSDLSDCHVIRRMDNFSIAEVDFWYDIGNIDSLKKTRKHIKGTVHVLDKEDENIFILNNQVIKFFYNKKICSDRVSRTKNLKGLVPKIVSSSENFYNYEYAKGDTLSSVVDINSFSSLLEWADKNLWIQKNDDNFKSNALAFYKAKTILRIDKFLDKYNLIDTEDCINGVKVPPLKELINLVDFESMIGSSPTGFHGDFILDNILIDNGKFTLIDWRQDFSGSIDAGDMNYDLAKLNHNLILDHETLTKNLFEISVDSNIKCDIYVKKSRLEYVNYLKKFCETKKIPYNSINTLSSIIWINMAPLHEHPLDTFLYYFGKYNLFLNLK